MKGKSCLRDYEYRVQDGELKKVCGGEKRSVKYRVKGQQGNKQSTGRITPIKRKININSQNTIVLELSRSQHQINGGNLKYVELGAAVSESIDYKTDTHIY